MSPCTGSQEFADYERIVHELERGLNLRISETLFSAHNGGQRADHLAMTQPSNTNWDQLNAAHNNELVIRAGTIHYWAAYTWYWCMVYRVIIAL